MKVGATVIALSILTACGGSQHPRPISDVGKTGAPQFIELRREVRANTLHFPAGTYSLSAADKIGYYYRGPQKISQHTAGHSIAREGGLFLSKRNRTKLRGYIYLGGAVTHVGEFSHADYAFRDAGGETDVPAAGPY
jgi:hypothetical protein